MKIITLLTTLLLSTQSYVFAIQNNSNDPAVVTEPNNLDSYIGKEIIIKGKVSNTKIPTILGVDVNSFQPDLRGNMAQAQGVLKKWIVPESSKRNGEATRRSPGTYYRLVNPKTGEITKVHPLNSNN